MKEKELKFGVSTNKYKNINQYQYIFGDLTVGLRRKMRDKKVEEFTADSTEGERLNGADYRRVAPLPDGGA